MNWTDSYEHVGYSIEVPVKLIHAIGAKGAVFVARLFYWKGKQKDADGWIYKTKHEMEEETGLARWEQDTCVSELKNKGILETRYERLDHRFYYRINKQRLDAIMGAATTAKKSVSPSESGNPDFGRESNLPSQIGKPDFAKPEIAISPKLESSCGEVAIPDLAYIKHNITYKEEASALASDDFSLVSEPEKKTKTKLGFDTVEKPDKISSPKPSLDLIERRKSKPVSQNPPAEWEVLEFAKSRNWPQEETRQWYLKMTDYKWCRKKDESPYYNWKGALNDFVTGGWDMFKGWKERQEQLKQSTVGTGGVRRNHTNRLPGDPR